MDPPFRSRYPRLGERASGRGRAGCLVGWSGGGEVDAHDGAAEGGVGYLVEAGFFEGLMGADMQFTPR